MVDEVRAASGPRFEVVDFGELSDAEVAAVLVLLQHEHPRWPWASIDVPAIDHLRWKLAGPDGDGMLVRGFEGDELVAAMPIFFSAVRLSGASRRRNHLNDSTITKAYQGRGLAKSRHGVFADSARGSTAHFEMTRVEHPVARRVLAKRGFREMGCPVDVFARVLDARRFGIDFSVDSRLPAWAWLLRSAGGIGRSSAPRLRRRSSDLKVSRLEEFGEQEDELLETVVSAFDLVCDRSSAYLNWRYLDPRAGDFTVRAAHEHGSLLGYCVTRVDGPRGYIADLTVLPERTEAATLLLEDSADWLAKRGASGVLAWMPRHHPHRAAMWASAFVRTPRTADPLYRHVGLEEETRVLGRRDAKLHLGIGDTDEV
jgi:hypothetical protein